MSRFSKIKSLQKHAAKAKHNTQIIMRQNGKTLCSHDVAAGHDQEHQSCPKKCRLAKASPDSLHPPSSSRKVLVSIHSSDSQQQKHSQSPPQHAAAEGMKIFKI